ncbi:MAG: serine hydrolase [Steroidobacteraceae bacterium]
MRAFKSAALLTHLRIALCVGVLFFGCVEADQVDDVVSAEMARQHIPGVSIAVVKNGKIVKEKGYGIANVEHQVPVTSSTVFQSGSVGKQFTAALTMLLVEDGKIKLDEPISAYLPTTPASWSKITVRHLLTHTSGMAAVDKSIDMRKDYSEEELLQHIENVPLLSPPGEKWAYSNMGYQVLGILCSRVGGSFYGDQLRERLFKPIGMGTRIISERDIVPHRAAGYDRVGEVLYNQEWVSPTLNSTGDGSLYLTAHDLALWSIALEGDQVLSKSMKDISWTPAKLNDGSTTNYGFGWFVESKNGHRRVGHGGAWQGFTTVITRFIDDGLAVIVLTNRSHSRPDLIVDEIAARYVPGLISKTAQPTAGLFASIPIYVRGTMNGWSLRDRMQKADQSIYEAELTLETGSNAFFIESEDGEEVELGAPFDEQATYLDKPKPLDLKADILILEVSKLGRYVFRVDVRDPHKPLLTVRPKAGLN